MSLKQLLSPVLAASSLLLASPTFAQNNGPAIEFPQPSPAATLKQRVGLTDIEVHYSRPSMRGRQIFGGLVPYDKVWRTGANAATRIKFSTPVRLNGTDLAAGTYELFTIPNPNEWTIIIHKDSSDWGAYRYDPKNDVARFKAKPVTLPNAVESFAIGFADLQQESATLYLMWEKTRVPVKLEVDVKKILVPQIEAAMASDSADKPYFQAAIFYFENNLDLAKASEWMEAAAASQPDAFWVQHHKARLHARLGQKDAALASAKKSIELAQKAGGAAQDEYIRLNEALIASLR